jgi:hypothetical protein
MTKIKVIDNFLPNNVFTNIKNTISTNTFPWFYNDHVCFKNGEENLLNNFMFTHNAFKIDKNVRISEYFSLFQDVLSKLNIIALVRIKLNLMLKTEKPVTHCMHTDSDEDFYKSAILYFENNDGGTVFENKEFIQNKENRIVLFNSNMKHSGVSQTNTKRRTVLNIVYT